MTTRTTRRGRPPRRRGRAPAVAALALAASSAVLVSGCGATGAAGGDDTRASGSSVSGSDARDGSTLPTAPVVRGDLVDAKKVPGTLGHGSPTPLTSAGTGTVTQLPSYGDVIGLDGVLYAVDESPVRALHGSVPLWRTLERGQRGADVAQLNDSLRALGYDVADDDVFGPRTQRAVRAWQRDREREVTGTLGASDIAFVPGDVRVAEVVGRVGDPAGEVVWGWTSTTLVATGSVAPVDVARFAVGAPVAVGLPDGSTVPGSVRSVGGPSGGAGDAPGGGEGEDDGRVAVVVGLDAELPPSAATTGAVDLVVEGQRRDGVLSVPVTALLAGDDGYLVEVRRADGSLDRVPVTTGFFAQGRVEVSGDGLAEGDEVVVPS
jgi:peptidoglycan hydrolase-like protein with peptidoglycan-binding domain